MDLRSLRVVGEAWSALALGLELSAVLDADADTEPEEAGNGDAEVCAVVNESSESSDVDGAGDLSRSLLPSIVGGGVVLSSRTDIAFVVYVLLTDAAGE